MSVSNRLRRELGIKAKPQKVKNPCWDFMQNVPTDSSMRGDIDSEFTLLDFDRSGGTARNPRFYRDYVTSRWAWALPAPETLQAIVDQLDGRPVVEIGAGNGYWAWMLSQMGVDINAYDLNPVGSENSWFGVKGEQLLEEHGRMMHLSESFEPFEHKPYYDVKKAGPEAVLLPENRDRALFLCWPTMDGFAAQAVRNHQADMVIYIGEGPMGCTADSEFFWLTEGECGCWKDEECTHANVEPPVEYRHDYWPIPRWFGLHDYLNVYRRMT